jgi:hypothetical protein
MLQVFFFISAGYDDVVQVAEDEGEALVVQPERHAAKLKQSERRTDGGFPDVSWVHGYLIITFPQVNFAKDLAPSDPSRKIQHVGQRVGVRFCDQVEAAEVAARPPGAFLLHHHVERAGLRRGRALHDPLPLQLLELRFGRLKLLGI